jgi:hypothetical protein
MRLAGVPVSSELVLELSEMLRAAGAPQTADILRMALGRGRPNVALTIADRDAILAVLEDPPEGLDKLHGALLRERTSRIREGL